MLLLLCFLGYFPNVFKRPDGKNLVKLSNNNDYLETRAISWRVSKSFFCFFDKALLIIYGLYFY